MNQTTLQQKPYIISLIQLNETEAQQFYHHKINIGKQIETFLIKNIKQTRKTFHIRGTDYTNLDNILKNGTDVLPTDSPIFAATDIAKSINYGWNTSQQKSLLLIYDLSKLKRTFVKIPATTSPEEIKKLQQIYPTLSYSKDQKTIWLSKLTKDDIRRTTNYEAQFGFYLPVNPFNSLLGLFLIGNFNENEIIEIKNTINNKTTTFKLEKQS